MPCTTPHQAPCHATTMHRYHAQPSLPVNQNPNPTPLTCRHQDYMILLLVTHLALGFPCASAKSYSTRSLTWTGRQNSGSFFRWTSTCTWELLRLSTMYTSPATLTITPFDILDAGALSIMTLKARVGFFLSMENFSFIPRWRMTSSSQRLTKLENTKLEEWRGEKLSFSWNSSAAAKHFLTLVLDSNTVYFPNQNTCVLYLKKY